MLEKLHGVGTPLAELQATILAACTLSMTAVSGQVSSLLCMLTLRPACMLLS